MIFGLPADVIIILSGLGANSVRVLVHLSGRQIAVLVFSRRSRFQATLKYVPSLASMLQPHAVSSENAHAATCLVGVDRGAARDFGPHENNLYLVSLFFLYYNFIIIRGLSGPPSIMGP